MKLITKRLILRPFSEEDAESLFKHARDPEIGPIAGWPPHKNVDESRRVIKTVLSGPECYAVCLRGDNVAIGCIELKFNWLSKMNQRGDECELGYWIGKEFWGRGLIPEAAKELIRRGFEDLNMKIIWCGYYDGNVRSKRVCEKVGFVYHHTCKEVPVPLLGEIRVRHVAFLTKEQWMANK